MKLKAIRAWILALILVLTPALCSPARQKGRTNNMKQWSPPDKSFSVEVPVNLQEMKGEYDDISHEDYKSIKLFASSEDDTSYGVFEVVILDLSKKEQLNVKGKLKGLEFFIGGDDRKPTKSTLVK